MRGTGEPRAPLLLEICPLGTSDHCRLAGGGICVTRRGDGDLYLQPGTRATGGGVAWVHSPLSEESSNEPALLRQTTSRVTLGLDDICHSQKFKISPLAFSARRSRMPACEAGREEGQQRGKERAHLQSCAPQTRWVMSSTTSSIVVLQQHSRTSVRAVARALCRLPLEPENRRWRASISSAAPVTGLHRELDMRLVQRPIS